ncbi:MAG: GNAT family N-acetyltransferase [Deltaproteobacteria bacterium]|nr:GNAT family N-acetyltransferase [Deltaproteobacteria bacterium]TLN03063.1 MAG: GNAT family N-acetyltransferase [bacterium]
MQPDSNECVRSKRKVTELFCNEDISEFLSLAAEEGWISDAWELEFLRTAFPSGCLVCRNKGIPVAFLTSIKYEKSGWIGNLLVRKEWRGQGLGSALFERALDLLEQAGTRTIWLTASESGRPIYERHGFLAIDTVHRWLAKGQILAGAPDSDYRGMLALDETGWGDRREELLRATINHGSSTLLPGGFLIRQRWGNAIQIGPWSSSNPRVAQQLLTNTITPTVDGPRIFLDVPEGNCEATKLMYGTGFSRQSSTTLMYRGEKPAYSPERIYALASMGSMG